MKAVVVDNLSKTFPNGKKALDKVSFSLEQGEIFGFLGPNGAGKTTTVKLLIGMLNPSEGNCSVFNYDPAESPEKVHGISGVVTEHAQMYDNFSGLQNLIIFGTLFGMTKEESEQRACELLDTLGLTDAKDQKLGTYSTGMRQRLSLARAMIHGPKMLFLDEPTSGLDPESAKSVNDMISNLAKKEGTTIFLCTHQLRYAEEICTYYGLVDNGRLLASGDIELLRSQISSGFSLIVRADSIPAEMEAKAIQDGYYDIHVESEKDIPGMVRRIVDSGANVYHVSTKQLSLEEIYFALIEKQKSRRV